MAECVNKNSSKSKIDRQAILPLVSFIHTLNTCHFCHCKQSKSRYEKSFLKAFVGYNSVLSHLLCPSLYGVRYFEFIYLFISVANVSNRSKSECKGCVCLTI